MAQVQAGSSTRLNQICGFASTIRVTEAYKLIYKDKVFKAGTFLYDDEGFLYHTDGVKTLTEVLQHPIVNKNYDILTPAERKMIAEFNHAGGFVALNDESVIDDFLLPFIDNDGKIDENYLSKYIKDGFIKPEVIPPDILKHLKFVKTYGELASVDKNYRSGLFFVIDATDDPTVESGWAIYIWRYGDDTVNPDLPGQDDDGIWVKIQEGEGIDYDYDSLMNHDTVEATGAVLYDHTLQLGGLSLDQFDSLEDPLIYPVFLHFKTNLGVIRNYDTSLNLVITTEHVVPGPHFVTFTLVKSSNLVLSGFKDGQECTIDNPVVTVYGDDIEDLANKLSNIVIPAKANVVTGTFTMSLDDYDIKEVNVFHSPYILPDIQCEDELTIPVNTYIQLPVTLSEYGVDPSASLFGFNLFPTGCSAKKTTSSNVITTGGKLWSNRLTFSALKSVLKTVLISVQENNASFKLEITYDSDVISKIVNVNPIWEEQAKFDGYHSILAADGDETLLSTCVNIPSANINPRTRFTLKITPNNVSLRNDGMKVASGNTISFEYMTADQMNTVLTKVSVIGDSIIDDNSISMEIVGCDTWEIYATQQWEPFTFKLKETPVYLDDDIGTPFDEVFDYNWKKVDPSASFGIMQFYFRGGAGAIDTTDGTRYRFGGSSLGYNNHTAYEFHEKFSKLLLLCGNGASGYWSIRLKSTALGLPDTSTQYDSCMPSYEVIPNLTFIAPEGYVLRPGTDPDRTVSGVLISELEVSLSHVHRDKARTIHIHTPDCEVYTSNWSRNWSSSAHNSNGFTTSVTANTFKDFISDVGITANSVTSSYVEIWFDSDRDNGITIPIQRTDYVPES